MGVEHPAECRVGSSGPPRVDGLGPPRAESVATAWWSKPEPGLWVWLTPSPAV